MEEGTKNERQHIAAYASTQAHRNGRGLDTEGEPDYANPGDRGLRIDASNATRCSEAAAIRRKRIEQTSTHWHNTNPSLNPSLKYLRSLSSPAALIPLPPPPSVPLIVPSCDPLRPHTLSNLTSAANLRSHSSRSLLSIVPADTDVDVVSRCGALRISRMSAELALLSASLCSGVACASARLVVLWFCCCCCRFLYVGE